MSQHVTPIATNLPSTIRQKSYNIENIHTDLVVQIYADRIIILISQLDGKIGTYLTSSVEESIIDGSTTYHISSLLGTRDDPLLDIYARQITERIHKVLKHNTRSMVTCPPILLGIAIPRTKSARETSVFNSVLNVILEMFLEAL